MDMFSPLDIKLFWKNRAEGDKGSEMFSILKKNIYIWNIAVIYWLTNHNCLSLNMSVFLHLLLILFRFYSYHREFIYFQISTEEQIYIRCVSRYLSYYIIKYALYSIATCCKAVTNLCSHEPTWLHIL